MTITIKSNPDGVSGAIQVNGVDKVTIGASGITAGSFAPNSIDAAAAALAFSGANQSLASNGYQKLPSGLIMQWGITGSISDGIASVVTLPVAFPNDALQGFATVQSAAGGTGSSEVAVSSITTTTITVEFNATVSVSRSVRWMAIGY